MRVKMLMLTLSLSVAGLCQIAQAGSGNEKYNKAMERGVALMNDATNTEDLLGAANHFERVAGAETGEWLPVYYDAYCRIMAVFASPDPEQAIEILDAAQNLLELAGDRGGDAAELAVLQGMSYHARIRIDASQAMSLGPQAGALLRKATAMDAANPRAFLLLGENLLYTPEAYGGGSSAACPLFEQAVALFAAQGESATEAPVWGLDRAQKNRNKCQAD